MAFTLNSASFLCLNHWILQKNCFCFLKWTLAFGLKGKHFLNPVFAMKGLIRVREISALIFGCNRLQEMSKKFRCMSISIILNNFWSTLANSNRFELCSKTRKSAYNFESWNIYKIGMKQTVVGVVKIGLFNLFNIRLHEVLHSITLLGKLI